MQITILRFHFLYKVMIFSLLLDLGENGQYPNSSSMLSLSLTTKMQSDYQQKVMFVMSTLHALPNYDKNSILLNNEGMERRRSHVILRL